MRDIPIFTTEFGVASLMLKEIPYRQEAYIQIQDVQPGCLDQLLAECKGFCVAAGAEKVYASGCPDLESYPLHTAVWQMRLARESIYGEQANLFPVTEQTVRRWREIYNQAMSAVDNAATLTAFDEGKLLNSSGVYFIHEDSRLLGIGWLDGDTVLAVATVCPKQGHKVLSTLLSTASSEQIRLEVASSNQKAIRLYERMGFLKTAEIARWYCV